MACNCNHLLFFVWLLIVKTDKHLLLLWLCNYYLISLYHDWSTEKLWNSISPNLAFNRKAYNHFLKSICTSELSWNFLKNTNAQVLLLLFFFFCQSSRYVSNEQPCLKRTGLMRIFYFYLGSLFLFHIQCSHFI